MLELLDLSFITLITVIACSAASTSKRNSCSYTSYDILYLLEALLYYFVSSSSTPKLFFMSLFCDKPFDFKDLLL